MLETRIFPATAPAWANAVLAVAAMKHTDISRQTVFLWLVIKLDYLSYMFARGKSLFPPERCKMR
jgi:hypothetical protein